MTRPIQHLEGMEVHFTGVLAEHRRQPGGELHLMLRTVELRRLDHTVPLLAQKPVAVLDHLWLTVPPEDTSPAVRKMLHRCAGIGTVAWYARANGSVDLGIRETPSLEIVALAKRVAASLPRNPHPDTMATAMEQALALMDQKLTRCWSNSAVFSRDAELADFRREVAAAIRNREANRSRLAASLAHRLARRAAPGKPLAIPFLPS